MSDTPVTDSSARLGPAERAGYPIDLPPGQHPYDWFISALVNTLGFRTAARVLGVEVTPEEVKQYG